MNMRLTDQRNSFRCPVDESRQQCELLIGDDRIPGTLLDESVGGFSVMVKQKPNVETHDKIQLGTDGGWFKAKVVHVNEIHSEYPEQDVSINELLQGLTKEAPQAETWYRLGLSRIAETRPPAGPINKRPLRLKKLYFFPHNNRMTIALMGITLAILMVAVPWGFIQLINQTGTSWYEKLSGTGSPNPFVFLKSEGQVNPNVLPSKKNSQSEESQPQLQPQPQPQDRGESAGIELPSLPSIKLPTDASDSLVLTDTVKKIRDLVQRMPGASTLLLPEVAQELQLTKEQQEKIQALADTTMEGMRLIDEKAAELGRQEASLLRAELLKKSQEDAIQYLNDSQKEYLHKLTQ